SMPFGNKTPTRSPGAKPRSRSALPNRSVSASNSRKLTTRPPSTRHGVSRWWSAAFRIRAPICISRVLSPSRAGAEPFDVRALQMGALAFEQAGLTLLKVIELVGHRRSGIVLDPGLAEMPIPRIHDRRPHFARQPIVFRKFDHAAGRVVTVDFGRQTTGAGIGRSTG